MFKGFRLSPTFFIFLPMIEMFETGFRFTKMTFSTTAGHNDIEAFLMTKFQISPSLIR